jgi:hypothetical protein
MISEACEMLYTSGEKFGDEHFIISITQDDNVDFFQCTECKKFAEYEGSHVGTMLRFVNAVARDTQKITPTRCEQSVHKRFPKSADVP